MRYPKKIYQNIKVRKLVLDENRFSIHLSFKETVSFFLKYTLKILYIPLIYQVIHNIYNISVRSNIILS